MPVFRTNDYGGNGLASGLSQGIALAQMLDEKKRRQGLASGVAKLQSGDETGWQEIAQNDPNYYLNYKAEQEKLANELEKQRIQRTFNKTNEMKNTEYLISLGYSPEEAMKMAFKQQKDVAQEMLDRQEAKQMVEDLDAVRTAEANYPQLEKNVNRLLELSPKATYTKAGQAVDSALKEIGITTEGAKARAEFESIVNNAVLPLLKQTFGSAFTAEEGLRLQKTLADPNASDKEKEATLRTFIEQKKADIETKKRKYGFYSKNKEETETNTPNGGSINGFKIERIE